jgi:hypothetical protein
MPVIYGCVVCVRLGDQFRMIPVRKGAAGVRERDALIARLNVAAVAVDGEQLAAVREGRQRRNFETAAEDPQVADGCPL